ncbi:hypothetical protein HAPAU_32590 [Halalkalicoccus paucihalophilus]|uniref:Uncharacterized protein n=1 Tax=Halalkalicoccus paucihalophilus TaxID=1008153 RepID=A0A151A995_9EURY|nr:hypothetical protein [Halalkalicoccus paucihalophilus]KYH24276.1 hypothetical protein HAPAU_32590 [Halalkalicoccus paucihalophilus]
MVNVTDNDKPGWHRVQVEASSFEDYVLNYDPDEDGDFDAYMSRYLHGSVLAPVEEQFHGDDDQSSEIEDRIDENVASPLAEMYANAEAND